jgi:hypothetical protein
VQGHLVERKKYQLALVTELFKLPASARLFLVSRTSILSPNAFKAHDLFLSQGAVQLLRHVQITDHFHTETLIKVHTGSAP